MTCVRIILLGCSVFSVCAEDEMVVLSFDSPFTPTNYKQALDLSMQIWGDLNALAKTDHSIVPYEEHMVLDVSAGRLAFIDWCLELLLKGPPCVVHDDDMQYLCRVFSEIDVLCRGLEERLPSERVSCLKKLVEQVQGKIISFDGG